MSAGISRLGLHQDVADTTHSMHLRGGSGIGQLLAQAVHIDFHCIRANILRWPEKMILDEPLGHDPAGPADQYLQERQLARAEGLRSALDKSLPCAGVEGQV